MSERQSGTVKWFNSLKGYGFIERENEDDIFVHYSAINMSGFRKLKVGQTVSFTPVQEATGLQAKDVVIVGEQEQAA